MPEVDFLRHLRTLYETRHASARRASILLKLGQSDDEYPKPAAWISAEKRGLLSELMVWSSGEAEFIAGRDGEIEVNEHHELERKKDLTMLFERLFGFVDP